MEKEKKTLLSFHGDQAIKDKYIARLQAHYKADEIIKGGYWENGKGCAVGCTVHSSEHDSYETELGISWRLAIIEDSIFENLPNEQAKEFPIQFLEAIPVGVDTELVFKKFIIWSLIDLKDGVIQFQEGIEKEITQEIAHTYQKSFTEQIPDTKWNELTAYATASTFAYASASAYAFATASTFLSTFASTFAYATAYASAFAYATATATASAYLYTYAERKEIFKNRVIIFRDKLLELLKEAK
jgi:hypothetical protein